MNLAEAFGGKFKGHEIKTAVSDVYDEKMNQETRIKQYIPVEPEKVLQIEPEKKVEQIQIKKESKKESKKVMESENDRQCKLGRYYGLYANKLGGYYGKYKKLGSSFCDERPTYLISIELAQDDCHLICIFISIFILSLLLSKKN